MKKLVISFVGIFGVLGICFAALQSPAQSQAAAQPKEQSLNSIAAIVNNDIITQSTLNKQLGIAKHQFQLQNKPLPPNAQLQKQVLNQLIDEKLILQIAANNNIDISNSQLNTAIANIAAQNHMSLDQLKQQVISQGINYSDYQRQIRKQLLMNATERNAVGSTIQVTDREINAAMKKAAPQMENIPEYHLQAMLVPVPSGPTPEQLQAAEAKAESIIKQLHEGNSFSTISLTETFADQPIQGGDMGWKQLTQLPPAIAAQVAGAVSGSIVGPVQTPNGYYIVEVIAARTLNATHNIKLTHLRTIILKQGETETGNEIKAKLEKIREKIIKGTPFAKAAAHYSEDSATAQKGGDLGWVAGNEVPPKVARAMEKLSKGQISQPINTEDGWQLIQVEGYKFVNNSNAHLKAQIRQMIYVQKFETAVKNWVQTLRTQAYIKIMN